MTTYHDYNKRTKAREEAEKATKHDKWIFVSIAVFVALTFLLLWGTKLALLAQIPH